MATFTATRAASTFPVYEPMGSGDLGVAYGVIEVTANPANGDVYQMCRVPKGAIVLGGRIYGDDLDTNATETLDLDVGWADNGVDAADPDGFGNLGVMGTDTVAGIKPESGYNYALGGVLVTDGPKTFAAETTITVNANAAAATFVAGTLSVVVYYVKP